MRGALSATGTVTGSTGWVRAGTREAANAPVAGMEIIPREHYHVTLDTFKK